MQLSIDELSVALKCLQRSTDTYESQGRTIQQSASAHLVYLKEKALIKHAKKLLVAK